MLQNKDDADNNMNNTRTTSNRGAAGACPRPRSRPRSDCRRRAQPQRPCKTCVSRGLSPCVPDRITSTVSQGSDPRGPLIPVLLMLVCGCRLVTESSSSPVICDEKVSAIVEAYKAVWHSFYDEGNFVEMFVVEVDDDESGRSRSFSYDYETRRIQDRIRLHVDELAYSDWKNRANQILDRAGAHEYIDDRQGMNGRIIAGSIFVFPAEVEERLRRFDRQIEEGRQEDFEVLVELHDKDDILMASELVPSYKFYRFNDGLFSLPMCRLTKVEDLLSVSGKSQIADGGFLAGVSYADIEFENVEFGEDRYSNFSVSFEIRKDCEYLRLGRHSDDARRAVSYIVSKMVEIQGKSYCACRFEVEQWEWEAIMGSNPSKNKGLHKPVDNVSWIDCRHFIDVLNSFPEVGAAGLHFRMPSCDEWLFACFGTSDMLTQLDESKKGLDAKGWFDFNSSKQTHNVGMKLPNGFGLFDMMGNVAEYTSDATEFYRDVCGGSCNSSREWYEEYSVCGPGQKSEDRGMRLFADKLHTRKNSRVRK